jgi:hypothetical protein
VESKEQVSVWDWVYLLVARKVAAKAEKSVHLRVGHSAEHWAGYLDTPEATTMAVGLVDKWADSKVALKAECWVFLSGQRLVAYLAY